MKTTVGEVMTTKVRTASPATHFRELAEILTSLHVSALPVVDADGIVVGVVSEADLMLKELIGIHAPAFATVLPQLEKTKAAGEIAAHLMTSPAVHAIL